MPALFMSRGNPEAGAEILHKYFEAVDCIESNPDLFPRKSGVIQRVILRRSYFVVYFFQEEARSIVLAVLDGRRNPRILRRIVTARRKSA